MNIIGLLLVFSIVIIAIIVNLIQNFKIKMILIGLQTILFILELIIYYGGIIWLKLKMEKLKLKVLYLKL